MPLLSRRVLHPLVLLAFTLLSAVHTWPLLSHLQGFVLGGREDGFMNMWHFWWMRQAAWVDPQNPFFSPVLHWPLGAELYWHTLSPAKTGWGVVLLPFMGPEVAYNLVIFGTFVLTGYTAWLLLNDLLRRAGFSPGLAAAAAVAGACAFDFSRYHLSHANAHLNLSALEGIPFYLWCFFRWLDEGKRRWLVGLALGALYVLLCDYYYLLYIALLSFAWIVAERWRRGPLLSLDSLRDPLLRRAGWAAAAAGIACVPPILPLLAHLHPAPIGGHHGDSDYFTDLYAFFLPDPLSAWFEAAPAQARALVGGLLREKMAGNAEEAGTFLGFLTLGLAAFALWRGVPEGRRWAGLGVGFAVLSMGTVLSMGGVSQHPVSVLLLALLVVGAVLPGWRQRVWRRDVLVLLGYLTVMSLLEPFTSFNRELKVQVPMPYVVFKHVVPLFKQGGMPVRFELLTTLSLSVLVAFAAAHLGALAARREVRLGVGVALLTALVPNLEYRNRPMNMVPLPTLPPVFEEIRTAPAPAAVFTDNVLGQWEQVVHGKPVSFARLSRTPVREAELQKLRLFRALEAFDGLVGPITPEEQAQMRAYLKEHHFRWYVSHYFYPPRHRFVTEVLGGELVHRDARYTVYRFP
ncbi:hypothetical protein POL68_13050 [Stigmatella sp. ncwal1]|uniref:Dolichyl-phosphate-mannose-protein mannosyltransferase n=1 Tax=Stigmatella ashevillensis TaxID=2995309 RepID=A0ABT5D8E1_9BACT|nr:hypothetical protein [Stigmatella ashevillena]MDC0709393.1 hypothetical protein [Stigmatella ashevillena]